LSDTETPPLTDVATPEYRAAQRWNLVWVVPIIALMVGGWMVWNSFHAQGPVAYIRFETASGLEAKKTEVRCRDVRVGMVKEVSLAEDLKTVVIEVELKKGLEKLLNRDTTFWVVKARATITQLSGLDTLLTGAYIELNPGAANSEQVNHFAGQDKPPATSKDTPGRRVVITADEAGSLAEGSPIYYRGFEVGRIESRALDQQRQQVTYDVFIRQEFAPLVKENTRFWNTSGLDISTGAAGFKFHMPPLQALISGGVTFGVPEGSEAGESVGDKHVFRLFDDEEAAKNSTFNPTMKFVLLFGESVRGLTKQAPVEFRGIPIGRVANISFDYLQRTDDSRIPVLIEIDPSLLRRQAAEKQGKTDLDFLNESVQRGLRASLKTGSLITGSLFVDLDYVSAASPDRMEKVGEYTTLPTVSSSLVQLTAMLDKIQKLPIEETLKNIDTALKSVSQAGQTIADAKGTMEEFKKTAAALSKSLEKANIGKLSTDLSTTLAALDKSVGSIGPDGAIQGDVLRTLDELRAASRAINTLSSSLEEKPSSLLWGRDSSPKFTPKAPKRGR
jgi:paraquat-inducible protein B